MTPIELEINDGTGYEYDGNVFVAWVLHQMTLRRSDDIAHAQGNGRLEMTAPKIL